MDIPEIATERLVLRAHRRDDFDALAAMWGDPAVARFIGGRPSTREESWARLLRYAGHWPLMGYGYWAVHLRGDGAGFIGDVGFADWQRDIDPPLHGLPEAGWVFSPAAHGRGLAGEAVAAALRWMDARLPGRTTACIIAPDNAASIRLAERHGWRESARCAFKGGPVIQFRRPAPGPAGAAPVDARARDAGD